MLDPVTSHLFRDSGYHGPIVLMYHAIDSTNRREDWQWSIALRVFKAHLDLLQDHGWSTYTLPELIQKPAGTIPAKTVAITFDDGFENNLDAVDTLVSRRMRATWFIATGAIGKTQHWKVSGRPPSRMLSANSLHEMKAEGMEIGSHSVNHTRLTELDDIRLASELTQSKRTLEEILARPVEGFAYPYGDRDERCELAVARAGYRYACTTRTGPALKDGHPLRLRRLAVFNNDSPAALARKLTLMTNEGNWTRALSYYGERAVSRLRSFKAR